MKTHVTSVTGHMYMRVHVTGSGELGKWIHSYFLQPPTIIDNERIMTM